MKEVNVFQTDKISFKDGILHGHNQDAYQKMRDALKYGNRAFIEHATGTGKSYLAIKLLKDVASRSDKKVLYVTSQTHLIGDFERMCQNVKNFSKVERDIDLETTTYASLNKRVEEHFDLIIFDEAQYMGAKKWGKAAETLLKNNPDAKVVGMSATPDRIDGKDVIEKFFEGEVTSHLPTHKAIAKEILPVPTYWLGQYKFDKNAKTDDEIFIENTLVEFKERLLTAKPKEKEKLEQIIDDLHKAQRVVAQTPELPTIFEQILSTEKLKTGKFIVFCPYAKIGENFDEEDSLNEEQNLDESLANMKKFMEKAPDWFGAINGKAPTVYGMHSKFSNKHNEENLKDFMSDKSKNLRLMYSINMLTLGKHLKDLDGIIMLRPTASKNVFLQQLGRALSVKGTKKPLVIDIVGNLNYSDFEIIKDFEDEVNQEIEKEHAAEMQRNPKKATQILFNVRAVNQSTMDLIKSLRENVERVGGSASFDKFMQHYQIFVDEKNEMYDSLDVPQELRNFHVPEGTIIDGYNLTAGYNSVKQGIIRTNEQQKAKVNEIYPIWKKEKEFQFDFGEFYGYLKKYVQERHAFYDALGDVPMELRELQPVTAGKNATIIDGYPLGQKLGNFKWDGYKRALPIEIEYLSHLIPNWKEEKHGPAFDFGKFYHYLKQFVDTKNEYYDALGVPQELRILQPPHSQSSNAIVIDGYKLSQTFTIFKHRCNEDYSTLTPIRKKYLDELLPGWENDKISWEYGLFYVRFKQFIEEKDKYYDSIGTPKHLRDYRIKQKEVIKDYPLGTKLDRIKQGKVPISKTLDDYLSALDPNWWKKRNKHGKIIEGQTKEETLKYFEDENILQQSLNKTKNSKQTTLLGEDTLQK